MEFIMVQLWTTITITMIGFCLFCCNQSDLLLSPLPHHAFVHFMSSCCGYIRSSFSRLDHSKLESQTVALSFCCRFCRHDDLQGRERELRSTSKTNLLRRTAHFLTALHVSLQVAQTHTPTHALVHLLAHAPYACSASWIKARLLHETGLYAARGLRFFGFYSRSASIRGRLLYATIRVSRQASL
jgi:hypothetical protein